LASRQLLPQRGQAVGLDGAPKPLRHADQERVVAHRQADQPGRQLRAQVPIPVRDHEIEPPLPQQGDRLLGLGLQEPEPQLRVPSQQGLGHRHRHGGKAAGEAADRQLAVDRPGQLVDLGGRPFQRRQHVLAPPRQRPPGRGQPHGPALAQQQRLADLGLQGP
jgi:hypothetical protein